MFSAISQASFGYPFALFRRFALFWQGCRFRLFHFLQQRSGMTRGALHLP
jgi:hypothetical protein